MHKCFFFIYIGKAACTFPLLELSIVEGFQLFGYGSKCLLKCEKYPVTQRCKDPCRCILYSPFRMGFVLWSLNPGRNNSSLVVLSEFKIAAVDDCIKAGILCYAGTKVIRNKKPRHSAEVFISMGMTEQPVFRLHVPAEFGISEAAAGKHRHKQVCIRCLAGNGIRDWQRVASPVDLHSVTWLMMDTHCCLRFSCPGRIIVIKLGLLVADLSCISAPGKVFCMEQGHRHPGPGKFPMDVFIIRLTEHVGLFGFLRIQESFQYGIRDGFFQRPGNPLLLRHFDDLAYRVTGCLQTDTDIRLGVFETVESQYLSIIHHNYRPPIE